MSWAEIHNPLLILALWGIGGAVSFFGTLTYAELGAMLPRAGGTYVYLQKGLGDGVAFVYGWSFLLIGAPLTIAGISVIWAEHMNLLIGTPVDTRILSCALISLLVVINTVGTRVSSLIAIALTVLKVSVLVLVVLLAVIHLEPSPSRLSAPAGYNINISGLGTAIAAVLWTFDGWVIGGTIAGDVKSPQVTLPRILLSGVVLVTVLYLAFNVVLLLTIPISELQQDSTVAPALAHRLLGTGASRAVAAVVVLSTLGAAHITVLAEARVTYSQSCDGLMFQFLSQIHPSFGTPHRAIWIQGGLACGTVWCLGTFERIVTGFAFATWLFYGLAAASMIALRYTNPQMPRPFRCPGFPFIPLAFVTLAFCMSVTTVFAMPMQTLLWLGILLIGFPAHWLWTRWKPHGSKVGGE